MINQPVYWTDSRSASWNTTRFLTMPWPNINRFLTNFSRNPMAKWCNVAQPDVFSMANDSQTRPGVTISRPSLLEIVETNNTQ